MRRWTALALIAVANAMTAGCSDGVAPSGAPAATPAPDASTFADFGTISVTVLAPDGTTRELCLLLADTAARRERGLMDVTGLAGFPGMAFRFGGPTNASFYMFRTKLPLSIAFIATGGRVVSTTDMAPCRDADGSRCPLYAAAAPYTDAIEVPKGDLPVHGLTDGATVGFGAMGCRPS